MEPVSKPPYPQVGEAPLLQPPNLVVAARTTKVAITKGTSFIIRQKRSVRVSAARRQRLAGAAQEVLPYTKRQGS